MQLELDTETGTIKAQGVLISVLLFDWFADEANKGRVFKFVERLTDGAVVIKDLGLDQ